MNSPCKPTLLLVDDDQLVLEALYELFCDDYAALLAQSGEAAIDVLRGHPEIAAVVLDIKMAGMDGVETFRQLKQLDADLPIIIHTGYPGTYQKQQIDSLLRPFEYIVKGKSFQQLLDAVKRACQARECAKPCPKARAGLGT